MHCGTLLKLVAQLFDHGISIDTARVYARRQQENTSSQRSKQQQQQRVT